MSKKNIFFFIIFFLITFFRVINTDKTVLVFNDISKEVTYKSHVQNIGWMDFKKNGEMSGTTGMSKRLEALMINLDENGIEYSSFIEGIGWQEYKKDGEMSGTTGKAKKIEAIKIKLYGNISEDFSVYYRVHVQNLGWLGWAKDGEKAGTNEYGYQIEAIEIKLLDKNEEIKQGIRSFYAPLVKYRTHIQSVGWTNNCYDGELSGVPNSSKRIEGIELNIQNLDGNIKYKSYVENEGWQEYKSNGETSGSVGKAQKLEAIQIELTGDIEKEYDVYYRVYVQNFGWLGWAKNGEKAGTIGYEYRIESIEIKVIDKNEIIKQERPSYHESILKYNSYIQDYGWTDYEKEGDISGTTGKAKRLEAFKIELIDSDDIEYKSYIEDLGWEDYKHNKEVSGLPSKSKKIEAIKINIKGVLAEKYNVYYRTHVEKFGWLGWAKNGESSGTIGYNYRIEAIQIKLLNKDEKIENGIPFYNGKVNYSSHVQGIGWMSYKSDGEMSGTTGEGKRLEGLKINLLDDSYLGNIEYRSFISGFGWEDSYKKNGELSGTTGKGKAIEAVQIKLTGDISNYYDVCYRVHMQNKGWLGWTQNGSITGSSGYNYRLEAIEIRLLKKEEVHPYISDLVYYMTKDGYYNISIDGKYLDSRIKSGSDIYLSEKSELKNQIWKIKDYNDGNFRIFSSMNPKLVINNKMMLTKYENVSSEIFKIEDFGNGYYDIKTSEGKKLAELLNINGDFKLEPFNGIKTYNGIDISKWQGNINWDVLMEENLDFIIMRVGTGKNNYEKDSRFEEYYSKASYYDIPIGVYMYSMALNIKDALKEAEKTVEWLNGKQLDLPIFYDVENESQAILGKDALTKIVETFCNKIKDDGYKCGIYANKYFLSDYLNIQKLSNYFIWLAHWTGANNYEDSEKEFFKTDYNLSKYNYWQFSSLGIYRGIMENTVDLDLGYDIFD